MAAQECGATTHASVSKRSTSSYLSLTEALRRDNVNRAELRERLEYVVPTLSCQPARATYEIPIKFVQDHGKCFGTSVTLQRPNGPAKRVKVSVHLNDQIRAHFSGPEWKTFLVENDFKVKIAKVDSTSPVALVMSDQLVSEEPRNGISHSSARAQVRTRTNPSGNLTNKQRVCGEPCVENKISNSSIRMEVRSSAKPPRTVENDVVYTGNTCKYKRAVEALLVNLGCPHFVMEMKMSHIYGNRTSTLSVPATFMQKYGEYFNEVHTMKGPSGRSMRVTFFERKLCARHCTRGRFTGGWDAFHKQNGFRRGDVLVFSLQTPGSWLVRVVGTEGHQRTT